MGYLLDTSIWVDIERGALAPADVASLTQEEPVYLSPVTIAELKYGAEITTQPDRRQKRLSALQRLMKKPVLRIDEETGYLFGSLAAQLKSSGRGHQFRIQDLWLASQSLQHGLRFLTKNRKDFVDIPGLQVVSL